ncbi:MAG TPA: 2-dehydropantoate 2-reductase [Caulobacter sp.]|nr:2-dehydropantoate 2-reductase [Caulobacter sp.]
MTSIAVIGPGAIGATVAAWLTRRDANAVTVCARSPREELWVEMPEGLIRARPTILTSPDDAPPSDWVLVATKTYDSDDASAWFAGLLRPDTRVAVLQNGVEHVERFSPYVDPARILPAVVDIPAERFGAGGVRVRRNGSILVPAGADGDAFVDLFSASPIAVSTAADWKTAAWRKLCVNCAGVVSALTSRPANVIHWDGVPDLMKGLVAECVAVGRAEGAALTDSTADEVVAAAFAAPPDSVNSILADAIANRRTEVDARNGVIVRLGAKHGIPTPLNAMAVTLLGAMQVV